MKAHEVPYGTCSLVELVSSDGVNFDSSVALRREIAILFSESTGQSLLRAGPTAVSVIGPVRPVPVSASESAASPVWLAEVNT